MCLHVILFQRVAQTDSLSLTLSSQFSPYIPKHAAAYVHHMIAYLCPPGHSLPLNLSSNCVDIGVSDVLLPCQFGEIIGVWAVGGEVRRH